MIGTTIDQYRIEARLGGGGMGEVFRARDLELDRDVAIKLVRPELSDLDEVTARFRAEARTLAGLAHSNIATVFRFFAHEGTLYLVMEYISGQPFGDMLRDKGARPAGEVVPMLKQALAGLGYAHDNKVVHRDIKPGNLMLDGHDTVKVLDFGIAHLLDQTRITQSGSVLGTPAYMAPEQVLGQQVDGRTDLYALGVVLFEMLTGKLPFRANSQFELMKAHLETQPRSLKEMNETVPRPLQETIVRALAKDSSDRYQTAEEFSGALDIALKEAEADGADIGTVVGARRSSVAVAASSTGTPATVARSGGLSTDTEIRVPTSVEIPLPEPKTAAGAGVAAVLLAGAGIWWFASGDRAVDVTYATAPEAQRGVSSVPPSVSGAAAASEGSDDAAGPSELGISGPTADNQQIAAGSGNLPRSSTSPSTGSVRSSAGTADTRKVGVSTESTSPTGISASSSPSTSLSPSRPSTASTAAPVAKTPVSRVPVTKTTVAKTTSSPRASSTSGYSVRATKVSAHERQGTGRLSRAAGYNGSFALSVPRGGEAILIDELIEVYGGGQQVSRQLVNSEVRKPGRFKSKQRIPGLKELVPGSYKLRLVFESGGRRLGQHEWTLVVSG